MKMINSHLLLLLLITASTNCKEKYVKREEKKQDAISLKDVNHVKEVPLPAGYERVDVEENSFGSWLRNLTFKSSNTIYLYNGNPAPHQDWAYKVIDVSTGNKNLQQCADVLMRLRAEYFFSAKAYSKINFLTSEGIRMSFENYAKGERYLIQNNALKTYQSNTRKQCYSHDCLINFLEYVFGYCGTYSVKLMTDPITDANKIAPGNVLVHAGSPGHGMMVADVALNKQTGKQIFLLLQGYMPAQSMHIVVNPGNETLSPWYEVNTNTGIATPGYYFSFNSLGSWK